MLIILAIITGRIHTGEFFIAKRIIDKTILRY
jgi:uncharacterized protein YneF (UPF0154 family)